MITFFYGFMLGIITFNSKPEDNEFMGLSRF